MTQLVSESLPPLFTPGVVSLTCIGALLCYTLTPTAQDRAVNHLPTPASTLPLFLNNTLDFFFTCSSETFYDFFLDERLKQKGKLWRMETLDRLVTVELTSPEAFEHVLKTKLRVLEDMLGNGVLPLDGTL